jgi:Fe-S oxidoreductase
MSSLPYGKLSLGGCPSPNNPQNIIQSSTFSGKSMLTTIEKALFLFATLIVCVFVYRAISRIIRTIGRGEGKPDWRILPARIPEMFTRILPLIPVFRTRLMVSVFHSLIAWGFLYYVLVDLGDLLRGYIPDFHFFGDGKIGDVYRLGADMVSVLIMLGMVFMLIRRFFVQPQAFQIREKTPLFPAATHRVKRDSFIVGLFILFHVGWRLLGESFQLALDGTDRWQPFASGLANLWSGWSIQAIDVGRHAGWWIALGSILLFLPYFLYSKHLHLFIAPLNFFVRPERRSIGELKPLDFEDQQIERFGADRLEHLPWNSIMDAYACIMCNRCQDACPAYQTGKVLSPAALEINKRYFLNQVGGDLAAGKDSEQTLHESVISPEAVWACTTCGACVQICPVANEPMQDIIEIRRHLVLMENRFPEQLQTAYRGMERAANPWNIPPAERMGWAEGLNIPTIKEKPHPEILWWVGCAPSTDPRAQKTARALARVLQIAGVDFAVLGEEERCTGDSARRSGNEYLFYELAKANVDILNQLAPPRIVTTCPHCMHTLKNEYPAFGGNFEVLHHTQFLKELLSQGRIRLEEGRIPIPVTFHDPCYLGRHNGIVEAPRNVLTRLGIELKEMERNRMNSFCCGAGGAQIWKEEEQGVERVSINRLAEAERTGVEELAVSCPFCMIMLNAAITTEGSGLKVRDVIEFVADRIFEE